MGDSQSSGGYYYLFGEADEITKRIEEYQRQHGRNEDSPPLISQGHFSENIPPTINYHQPPNQPTMHNIPFNSTPAVYHSSQDISHHQFQYQPTMSNTVQRIFCWRCFTSIPRHTSRPLVRPMPFDTLPPSVSEHFWGGPNQHSHDEIFQRSEERERVNVGVGLTEKQISQLPTIKFQPSIEDKKCMICQSDYARGEKMIILPCTHKYHEDCIRPWLRNSKLCCICQSEVVVRR